MTSERLDSLATSITILLAFLLPVIFVPLLSVSQQETKFFLLAFGVLFAVLLWSIARLKDNTIEFPYHPIMIPFVVLPIVALLSSFFSGNTFHSLLGQQFSLDTALMIFVLSMSFGIGALLFTSKDKVIKLYLAIIASALIVFLFQAFRLSPVGDLLSLPTLPGNTANLLGKWNDLAVFAGVIALLSSITLEALRPQGLLRVVAYIGLALALLTLVVVDFTLAWVVLAILSFVLLVRSFLERKVLSATGDSEVANTALSRTSGVSRLYLFVCTLSVIFVLLGSSIGVYINQYLNVGQVEARPSWQSTSEILGKVYDKKPLLGVGPNNFTREWLLNKPLSTNTTPFWNIDFLFGVGIIPTFFITSGVLGIGVWVAFFVLFLWVGVRALARIHGRVFDTYIALSSFFAALFLWVLSVFYVPHPVLFFFAFLFSGVFVVTQTQSGMIKTKKVALSENVTIGFVGTVSLFVFVVIIIGGLYASAAKYISEVYVGRTYVALNVDHDLEDAAVNINRAQLFNKSDRVFRAAAEVSLQRFSAIVNAGGDPEAVGQLLQPILTAAIENGRRAVSVNGANYLNWVALGRIYETLIPFGVSGAYENAMASYGEVLRLNPRNPLPELYLGRVEILNGNSDAARMHIAASLQIKQDFTDAIFLLSQLEVNEGNIREAISSIEAATLLSPSDPLVFFHLGLLRYSGGDYEGAITALERATALDSQYANAHYFLGLSYYEVGRRVDATKEFTLIRQLDPNATEVTTILENLIAGRAPLENFTPPEGLLDETVAPAGE